jgi:hypothetical protein
MEKITKNKNGQWDIEKVELNLDKEMEENKKGPVIEPDFPSSVKDKKEEENLDRKKKMAKQPMFGQKMVPALKKTDLEERIEKLEKALEDLKKQNFRELKALNQAKQKIGVKTSNSGEAIIGSSPALSGVPKHYPMAVTKTGKQIMSTHGKGETDSYHSGFTPEDHKEAYWIHGEKAKELSSPQMKPHVHPDLPAHHDAMSKFHWNEYIKSK